MNIKIKPTTLNGEVEIISSKSFAHRLLIASSLTRGESTIRRVNGSQDVTATIGVLRSMGTRILRVGDTCYIDRVSPVSEATLDCVESGSTLRFCMPLASSLGIDATFTGSERLLSRPIGDLTDCLQMHGIEVDGHHLVGILKSGIYRINSSVSSQYVTGLLMSLPLLEGDSTLILEGDKVSRGYIDITLDVLKDSDIVIDVVDDHTYFIKGGQCYRMKSATVEGDWSNAGFFLVAGATSDIGVTVKGLNKHSVQGDRAIIDVLKMAGAEVIEIEDGYTVKRGNPRTIDIDCEDIIDLVPIISVLCTLPSGDSTLRGVSRLVDKESDRLYAVIDMLRRAGVSATSDGHTLTIHSRGAVEGGDYLSYNDHRMVMSASILSSIASGDSTIEGIEAVNKSYNTFFRDFSAIGGQTYAMDRR